MAVLNGSLKPYLTLSAGFHLVIAVAVSVGLPGLGSGTPEKVYRIDFVGETQGILNRTRPSGKKKASAPKRAPLPRPSVRPQKDPDRFPLKPSFASKSDLPKPTFAGRVPTRTPVKSEPVMHAPEAAPSEEADPAAAEGSGDGGGEAEVSADIPDFPYPWYLQRIRAVIWDRWSTRMPAGPKECSIVFTVMNNGRVVDLQVETTSGDSGFDFTALSAVKDSGPFQPLPPAFPERFLRIHILFKAH